MKKLNANGLAILSLILLLFATAEVKAQKKSRIYVAYGTQTHQETLDNAVDFSMSAMSAFQGDLNSTESAGVFLLGYSTAISPKIEVGGVVGYESLKGESYALFTREKSELKTSVITVMAEAKYNYINKEKMRLYSGVGIGAAFLNAKLTSGTLNESNSSTEFAFQIDGIGFSYGDKFAVFANAGYGYKGIATVGVSYNFD
ncbi:outer membrane beta-barrel protein [Flavobacterium sp. JP2137]|uniref:outer membrane beta-barrel protein n=1 Tax=Flavobacterium sp. JP2137 TaxID=3414510 RepID=UPI003D2FA7F5